MDVCLWTWSCQFLTVAVRAEQPRPRLCCTVSYMRVSLVAFRPVHVRIKGKCQHRSGAEEPQERLVWMFACGHGLVNFLRGRCVPSSLGRYCFLHSGFPCCFLTDACADGQGSLSQAALPKAAMFDAVAIVLRGMIAIY